MIFQVSSLQKSTQNPYKNAFEKNIEKNIEQIGLGTILGSKNLLKIPPRAKKIASKVEPKKKLQRLTGPGARPNAPHPPDQAQEAF